MIPVHKIFEVRPTGLGFGFLDFLPVFLPVGAQGSLLLSFFHFFKVPLQ
jgi:hypothetical protein